MTFTQSVKYCLSNYATFSGRAQRSQYWWWTLFTIIVGFASAFVDAMLGFARPGTVFSPLSTIVSLALFVPGLAVSARRIHDIDRSFWWVLLGLVPIIGWIVLLYWYCKRGTIGPNRFGEDPLPAPAMPAPGAPV